MDLVLFDSKNYEAPFLNKYLTQKGLQVKTIEEALSLENIDKAKGCSAICAFVNDRLDRPVLEKFKEQGGQLILLRCAGYNHIDLKACKDLGLIATHVPEYSPYAVAEFTMALILELSRKIFQSVYRTKEYNFHLDGLLGFDLNGKTVGVVGTGKIGSILIKILNGFGCEVLAYDIYPDKELEQMCKYVSFEELLEKSDVVSLNIPLNEDTKHIINRESLGRMKKGSYLVNTGRGGLVDSKALISAIESKHLSGVALDVYEQEQGVFFIDHSKEGITDEVLKTLLKFPNVIISSHQAFLTQEALDSIFKVTGENLLAHLNHQGPLPNQL